MSGLFNEISQSGYEKWGEWKLSRDQEPENSEGFDYTGVDEYDSLIQDGEWDTLIILDACRFDMLRAAVGERVKPVYSSYSDTRDLTS